MGDIGIPFDTLGGQPGGRDLGGREGEGLRREGSLTSKPSGGLGRACGQVHTGFGV